MNIKEINLRIKRTVCPIRERENLAGTRYRDMNWWGAGIKAVVQQRGENPFHGERRVKERGERESSASGLCKKNISPKPLTRELKGTDYYKFLQAEELKF